MLGFNKTIVQVDLVEPLVFLREPPSWSAYASGSSSSSIDQSGSCQLRGVVTIESKKSINQTNIPKYISVSFMGTSRSMNWQNGVSNEEELILHDQTIKIDLPKEVKNEKEALSFTYTAPFSISVPSDIPPTIDTEFGRVDYQVFATVYCGHEIIAKSATNKDVRVVYDAANPNHVETETPQIGRVHTFEGDWQESIHWKWICMANASTTGGYVPIQLSLSKIENEKSKEGVYLKSIKVSLTEQTEVTSATANIPTVVRRSWNLLAIEEKGETLLPLRTNTTSKSDLINAAQKASKTDVRNEKMICDHSSLDTDHIEQQLVNPNGPWSLGWDVQLPVCAKTRCQSTVIHPCSPVKVFHTLYMILQFQKGDQKGEIFELKTSMPFIVRSLYLTDPYSQLPCYWCACYKPHPYEAREERSEGGILTYHDPHPQSMTIQESAKEQQITTNWLIAAIKSRSNPTTSSSASSMINRQCTAERWIELSANGGLPPPSYTLSPSSALCSNTA